MCALPPSHRSIILARVQPLTATLLDENDRLLTVTVEHEPVNFSDGLFRNVSFSYHLTVEDTDQVLKRSRWAISRELTLDLAEKDS